MKEGKGVKKRGLNYEKGEGGKKQGLTMKEGG